jgi:uncharacterized protein YndB with AHSA1/START domain
MTETIAVDQFIAQPPSRVWDAISTPDLLSRWWVAGDIAPVVGHTFHLDMGPWGPIACEVLEVVPGELLAYTFGDWTLTWRVVAEGSGTRLLLEHAGFDLDDPQHSFAFDMMGPGWVDDVLPRIEPALAEVDA